MMAEEPKPVNEEDLKQLKERMNMISSADPTQYHNDFSLKRYLRAFGNVDSAFQVSYYLIQASNIYVFHIVVCCVLCAFSVSETQ